MIIMFHLKLIRMGIISITLNDNDNIDIFTYSYGIIHEYQIYYNCIHDVI